MANDVFQKFKSSVNRGITTISVKTSSTLEKTKIRTHIESLNREIAKELTSIGDTAYRIWLSGETDFSVLSAKFEVVKSKYKEVGDLTVELDSIDERDSQILGNNAEEVAVTKPNYTCPSCGAQYDVAVKFCRRCGNKMPE